MLKFGQMDYILYTWNPNDPCFDLVLIGKNLVLEGSRLKIEDICRFQVDTYLVFVNTMSPAFCLI